MNVEKQKQFLIKTAYYGVILSAVYLGLRYLVPPLVPFLIGFLIAWMLQRPSIFVAKKLHIQKKLPTALLTALFYIMAAILVVFTGFRAISAVGGLAPRIPEFCTDQLIPFVNRCLERVEVFLNQYDPSAAVEVDTWAGELSSAITRTVTSVSANIVKLLPDFVISIPSAILKIVLIVVSTFFISLDFERIAGFIKRVLPGKVRGTLYAVKDKTIDSLKVFVRSYVLLFFVTFAELSVGFLILKVPYAVVIGLLVAVVDIMPVLGTGVVLLPWAFIAAVMKNIPLAVGLVLLYIVITVVRNILEPRLVGRQIGLHPLATLVSMFVGLQLFGIIGLFVCPVLLSLLVQFRRDGVLPLPFWMREEG